jgi:hypothetical protein
MFIPNSPRPPRGIASKDCVDLLKESLSPSYTKKVISVMCIRIVSQWDDRRALRSRCGCGVSFCTGKSRSSRLQRGRDRSRTRLAIAAAEEMGDEDEKDGADGGGG